MKKVLLILSIMIVVFALASCGHIHLPGEKLAIEQEPTCTKDGLGYIYCLECGEVAKIVVIPASGTHKSETIPAKEATCTEKGSTEGERCSWCGEILVSPQETPVVAHTYDDKYDETCNECGHVRDAECAHVETDVIKGKDATCTEIGYTDGAKCKKCGETVTAQEVIPTIAHSYSTVVTSPTCTAQGYTTYTCGCGDSYVGNYVSTLDHDYAKVVTKPTCTEQGYTTHICDCGDSYIDTFVNTIPHSFGEWKIVKEATQTEEGLKERFCSCGEKESEIIPLKASEGLNFALNRDGQGYTLIGKGSCVDTDIVVPGTYNGLPVTTIGYEAFYGCTSITSIKIPNSVTSIDTWVFAFCTSLISVEIPNSVTSIGEDAFYRCTSLMNIEIPDSVTSIGRWAFAYCTALTSIEIPTSVTSMGEDVFYACKYITVYCKMESQPSEWDYYWNALDHSDNKVHTVWGYKGN